MPQTLKFGISLSQPHDPALYPKLDGCYFQTIVLRTIASAQAVTSVLNLQAKTKTIQEARIRAASLKRASLRRRWDSKWESTGEHAIVPQI